MPEPHPFPDEFAPVGSSAFYAIRFAPIGLRPELSLANAFYRTLRNIPLTCSDPGVAMEKLSWWRQEIQRSRQAQAQHPIAISMGRLQAKYTLPNDYFEPLFQVVGEEIHPIVMQKDSDLENHCRQTGGLFADLLAHIGGSDEMQRRSAIELGSYLRMVEIIRDLGSDLRRNRCFISVDRLTEHRLSPAELLNSDEDERLKALLFSLFTLQQQRYEEILRNTSDLTGLGPVLSMAAMAERLFRMIHKQAYRRILYQRTSLTPLQKLWICWRCQRTIR